MYPRFVNHIGMDRLPLLNFEPKTHRCVPYQLLRSVVAACGPLEPKGPENCTPPKLGRSWPRCLLVGSASLGDMPAPLWNPSGASEGGPSGCICHRTLGFRTICSRRHGGCSWGEKTSSVLLPVEHPFPPLGDHPFFSARISSQPCFQLRRCVGIVEHRADQMDFLLVHGSLKPMLQ